MQMSALDEVSERTELALAERVNKWVACDDCNDSVLTQPPLCSYKRKVLRANRKLKRFVQSCQDAIHTTTKCQDANQQFALVFEEAASQR